MDIFGFLDRQNKAFLISVSFLLILFLGYLDYRTGAELSLSFFYLIPVCIVAGVSNFWFAAAAATFGSLVWTATILIAGRHYAHPFALVWNSAMRFGVLFVVGYLTCHLRKSLRQQIEVSHTDYLTGAANARLFHNLLNAEVDRARRYKRPFTLAYVDVDNFKSVNDRFGHDGGDTVLRTIATTLMASVRKTDVVGRLGGDEFALLLSECGEHDARNVIKKIQTNLKSELSDAEWPVTFSIGALTSCEGKGNMGELIKTADSLMYRVKNRGKDGVLFAQDV